MRLFVATFVRISRGVAVLFLAGLLGGCPLLYKLFDDDGKTSSGVTTTILDISGTWTGSWTSDWGAGGSLGVNWTQTGSNFSGSVTIGGSTCFGSETTSGSITGTSINVSSVSGSIAFLGTVSGSTMTGTYVTYRTICSGDTGVWTVTR